MDWLQNRNVKFAVGCTVLFILVRWLLTGDLLLAVAAFSEPADGETQTTSVWSVVWPIFFEAMVIVGGSVIAFAVGLWDRLADLLWSQQPKAKPVTVGDAAQDLLRAVAMGDKAAVDAASRMIRKEYAPGQVNEAIAAGDFERAKKLLAELEELNK